jgi:hypothetical protein
MSMRKFIWSEFRTTDGTHLRSMSSTARKNMNAVLDRLRNSHWSHLMADLDGWWLEWLNT